MTGVTRQLSPSQARELQTFADGKPRSRASTNLIRRDLVRSAGHGRGYQITSFGRDVLARAVLDGTQDGTGETISGAPGAPGGTGT